jgi:hypothetical protein
MWTMVIVENNLGLLKFNKYGKIVIINAEKITKIYHI